MTRRILITIAVLPLIVMVGLRSAWAAYACRIDGQVRDACCCPKKSRPERTPIDDPARLVEPDCCDVTTGTISNAPDSRETERVHDAELSVAVAPEVILVPVVRSTMGTIRATRARPPPPSIPTYLANRSILR